jgi:integrase
MSNSLTKENHERRKTEMSLRFRHRTEQANDDCPRPLLITLRMNGKRISDYNSGVKVRPPQWSQQGQLVKGRTQSASELNEQLSQIALQHREILRELKQRHAKGQGLRPTPEMVKAEFLRPGSSSPTLWQWYGRYLDFLDSLDSTEDGKAQKTIERAYKARDYFYQFDKAASPLLSDLTTGWGKRFHIWLQLHPETGERRMQKDTANKYLADVRKAVDHAIDEGYLSSNPLDKFRPKRGKGKAVYFLEPEHLERLLGIQTSDEQLRIVLWWTKLMCFTGLDYKDAIRYAKAPHRFHQQNAAGIKIVINRTKPPRNTCEIPLIGQVREQIEDLFQQHPSVPPVPGLADINRHLKVIQPLIGFSGVGPNDEKQTLTSKILRKTAGALLLREGFKIDTVSKALGHSSIRVTEEHYVKVTTSATDYDMERVARQQALGTIKLRPDVIQLPILSN